MKEVKSVVIRFSGDSGDGMQLTGTQFSNTSALMGNDISTFPDFPSEIRAPQGTVAGVSGFQVHLGASEVTTHGDEPDVLVAMNPAALKANLASIKKGGVVIVNLDAFDKKGIGKAGYSENPLDNKQLLDDYQVIKAHISNQTLESLKDLDLDNKSKARCKNFYALGITYFLFGRSAKSTIEWIEKKFAKKPILAQANVAALRAGRNYAETLEAIVSLYTIIPKAKIKPGRYRQVNGNTATAWGMIQAAKAAGLELFLGSYPITPATDILHELSHHKHFGVKTFQAEDEIAGICSAIGASFAGALALTTTSGPGLALKGEAIGLAVICEVPLVIVNVQRGGPSTGLPTKTEQSDLNQALFGRNGESPVIVLAASRPSDCFEMAFEASRLALEHMHPVILLTDGYIANGAEPWKIPDLSTTFNKINHRQIKGDEKEFTSEDGVFLPYKRDDKNFSRPWAIPGTAGFEHRIGGLERENITGNVSHNPENHQVMTDIRAEKIMKVQQNIPAQKLVGDSSGDVLVLSWGGSYGACYSAVKTLQDEGKKVSLAHLRYINPMPANIEEIIGSFKRVLVPELNNGQMRDLINSRFQCGAIGYNKVQGLPFKISEVVSEVNRQLESL
jgi:2-oxoglutarate/2-oxoacid ferredoxin oxidoreductase subunit alpha